jgi:hypothetical protein
MDENKRKISTVFIIWYALVAVISLALLVLRIGNDQRLYFMIMASLISNIIGSILLAALRKRAGMYLMGLSAFLLILRFCMINHPFLGIFASVPFILVCNYFVETNSDCLS